MNVNTTPRGKFYIFTEATMQIKDRKFHEFDSVKVVVDMLSVVTQCVIRQ